MKKFNKDLYLSIVTFISFILWTVLISIIDIQPIGPQNTVVGFATINKFIHTLTGVNMLFYTLTDWLSIIPVLFVFGFAFLGLIQLIQRKNVLKVDLDILFLGLFYITVFLIFFLFEKIVINYRPVLINGQLEASYPSSTTLLVLTVMPTAIMQFKRRIKPKWVGKINIIIALFVVFMVLLRLISGAHWFTDIIGGILLSISLVATYHYINKKAVSNF